MTLKQPVLKSYKNINIIEGTYSMHPYFKDYYDLSVFIDIDDGLQKERIIKRNGKKGYENFKNRWIPLENTYFGVYKIKNKADIIIENEKQ